MIVSVVSMPEGVVARTGLAQARERLAATSGFVIVDIDLGDEPPPRRGAALRRSLGLDDAAGEWLGRARTSTSGPSITTGLPSASSFRWSAETRSPISMSSPTSAGFITVHHGPVELIEAFLDQAPQDLLPTR